MKTEKELKKEAWNIYWNTKEKELSIAYDRIQHKVRKAYQKRLTEIKETGK